MGCVREQLVLQLRGLLGLELQAFDAHDPCVALPQPHLPLHGRMEAGVLLRRFSYAMTTRHCHRTKSRIVNPTMPAAKTKVSVTVDRTLLREVDRLAGSMTRSQAFERALAAWVRRRGQAELDRAIEHYYRSLSAAERREDDEWASLGDEAARRAWDE